MKFSLRSFLWLGVLFLCIGIMSGCATTGKPSVSSPTEKEVGAKKGVYHKVSKGETLWRIARTYKVSVDEIIQANNIPAAATIEEDQLLFVPGADAVQPVVLASKDVEYLWPLKGRIVSYFEDRKGAHINPGVDIKGIEGEGVKASREGRVVLADYLAGYGQTVILDHSDGFFTVYGRNTRILVKLGDYVFRGEKIGQIGEDGASALMHFEIRKGDAAKNPLHYLPREM